MKQDESINYYDDLDNDEEEKEKTVQFWINKEQFIILPYIGISWQCGFEICFMWMCFCLSIIKQLKDDKK